MVFTREQAKLITDYFVHKYRVAYNNKEHNSGKPEAILYEFRYEFSKYIEDWDKILEESIDKWCWDKNLNRHLKSEISWLKQIYGKVGVKDGEEIVVSYLDINAVVDAGNYKDELHFDKENSKKLRECLNQKYSGTLIGILERDFYSNSNLEEWFKIEEFEAFCDDNSIERTKVRKYGMYYKNLQLVD